MAQNFNERQVDTESPKPKSLAEELCEIGRECARLPIISDMTSDELLGYDEFGAPTR